MYKIYNGINPEIHCSPVYYVTNLKILVQVPYIVVKGDESAASPAESNLVTTVVPPVVEGGGAGCVPERNHGVDLPPAVLAYPAIAASLVLNTNVKLRYQLSLCLSVGK